MMIPTRAAILSRGPGRMLGVGCSRRLYSGGPLHVYDRMVSSGEITADTHQLAVRVRMRARVRVRVRVGGGIRVRVRVG